VARHKKPKNVRRYLLSAEAIADVAGLRAPGHGQR
jgi:hypothetical protein